MLKKFVVVLAGAVVAVPLLAAIDTRPTALVQPLGALAEVQLVTMPPVDVQALLAEDARNAELDVAPRYAKPIAVDLSPESAGNWEAVGDEMVWRLRLSSPGALSLNLGFTRYSMPAGGRLFLYAPDQHARVGPFTERDNEAHGELWTPVLFTDELVVEVTVPAAARAELELRLTSVNHDYRGFGSPLMNVVKSGSCNVDVVCPVTGVWRPQVRAVGVISTGGSTFCTGSLVNNTARDFKPYFMTANHCGINAGNAASLVVFWNYQNSVCRGEPGGGGAGDGTFGVFNTGSFFRAAHSVTDFTLVELDDPLNPRARAFLAGWNRGTGDPGPGTCIHHPSTDEKRITFYNTATTTSYNNPTVPGNGSHIHAVWTLGVTEPGSSGSPLYDQNKRFVGQLHGGPSACGAGDLSDYYGRFSGSWTGNGTNATRASNWLDPGATGVTVLDGMQRVATPADFNANADSEGKIWRNGTWIDFVTP